jgi:hypothetical protein
MELAPYSLSACGALTGSAPPPSGSFSPFAARVASVIELVSNRRFPVYRFGVSFPGENGPLQAQESTVG